MVKFLWDMASGFRLKRHSPRERLFPPDLLQEQLLKERAGADRAGAGFTMLVFDLEASLDAEIRDRAMRVLASVLLERTRISDTKGPFADRLGVILPHTMVAHIAAIWGTTHDDHKNRMFGDLSDQLPLPRLSHEAYLYRGDFPGTSDPRIDLWKEMDARVGKAHP
jgi:hypothetical protein